MLQIFPNIYQNEGSLVAQVVENLPAMQETQVWSLGQEDPLEKGMAIHSSILAWSIPWKEELDGLQSMGSQKVKHNGATEWLTSSFPYHNKQDVTWLLTGLHPEHFDLGVLRRFSSAVSNEWDLGSTPGSERSPGEGNGNLLQYYCLENPMDRGAWRAWGCKESDRTEQLTHTQAATQAAAEKKENGKGHFKAESLILRIHRKIFPGDSHNYLTEFWVRLEFLKLWEQMWRNIILLLFCEQILPPGMVWETWVIATRIIYFPWEVIHPSYEDCFTLKMNYWQTYRIPLPELY